ncbi:MAG: type II secretion system F family protein, partial [Candidatus Binatia bacterium]
CILRLPLVGHLARLVSLARFSSTLSTLLSSGVPMLTALDVAKRVTGNRVIENAVEMARLKVKEGGSLGATLRLSGMVPPLMVHLITVGEKGGTLEGMLHHCATLYEAEVDRSLTRLTSLLEPIMILAMGGFVLFLVLAVLLPLVEMNQMVR